MALTIVMFFVFLLIICFDSASMCMVLLLLMFVGGPFIIWVCCVGSNHDKKQEELKKEQDKKRLREAEQRKYEAMSQEMKDFYTKYGLWDKIPEMKKKQDEFDDQVIEQMEETLRKEGKIKQW